MRRAVVNQCVAVVAGNRATATANVPSVKEAVEIGTSICIENGATDSHTLLLGLLHGLANPVVWKEAAREWDAGFE